MRSGRVVVVPSTLALLPVYAGIEDPLPELRAAALSAVGWLVARHPEEVQVIAAGQRDDNLARGVTESAGSRVANALLVASGLPKSAVRASTGETPPGGLLVVANGSATRGERAPGHLDDRAAGFDESIGKALRAGAASRLADLDETLASELWCHDGPAWRRLGALAGIDADAPVLVDYDDDPYDVQYWVMRWTCGS